MKKIIAMLVMIAAAIGALLLVDNAVPLLDEYAKKLGDPTLLVCADGTVWRVREVDGKGWTVELEYTLKEGSVCLPQMDGSDARKMSALEYFLFRMEKVDKESWAVSGDGSIWRVYPDRKNTEMHAHKYVTAEIPNDQFYEGFVLDELNIINYPEYATLNVWLRDGSGTLINPSFTVIDILIDGEWYNTGFDATDTADIKVFGPNGEYLRTLGLRYVNSDYSEWRPWPTGHYRIMGSAYRYDPESGYDWSIENRVYTPPVEFDIIYKDGELKIENIEK